MMNATTEATKLNFMTDQGSTRASVSIAWRLAGLRTWGRAPEVALVGPRRCQAEVTEFARPAAAPRSGRRPAPGENPLLAESPLAEYRAGAGGRRGVRRTRPGRRASARWRRTAGLSTTSAASVVAK